MSGVCMIIGTEFELGHVILGVNEYVTVEAIDSVLYSRWPWPI